MRGLVEGYGGFTEVYGRPLVPIVRPASER